jgi:hypothetical protein
VYWVVVVTQTGDGPQGTVDVMVAVTVPSTTTDVHVVQDGSAADFQSASSSSATAVGGADSDRGLVSRPLLLRFWFLIS